MRAKKYKNFMVRTLNWCLILAALVWFNNQIPSEATEQSMESPAETGDYQDGTYQGSAQGFGGPVTVEVEVQDGVIADITILSADGEDPAYLSTAEAVIDRMLQSQSTEVDMESGATFSSNGIIGAVENALESGAYTE